MLRRAKTGQLPETDCVSEGAGYPFSEVHIFASRSRSFVTRTVLLNCIRNGVCENILQQLRTERDRLSKAIEALEGTFRAVRTTPKGRGGAGLTAAGRRRLSELMKERSAERRKKNNNKAK